MQYASFKQDVTHNPKLIEVGFFTSVIHSGSNFYYIIRIKD